MKTLLALLLLVSVASAGTTISGTFKYPDGTLLQGYMNLRITTPAIDTCAGNKAISTVPVRINIVNGVVTVGPTLSTSDCLSPVETYAVELYDSANNLLLSDNWYLPSMVGSNVDVGTLLRVTMSGLASSVPKAVVQTPIADQIIVQPTGTSFGVSGPGSFKKQASTDVAHGITIERTDVTASWNMFESASSQNYAYILQGTDSNALQQFFKASLSGAGSGLGQFTVTAAGLNTATSTAVDFGGAASTIPFSSGTTFPTTCIPKKQYFNNENGANGAKLNVCAVNGISWDLVAGGGGGAVTSVDGKAGAVVLDATDFQSLTATLSNHTLDCTGSGNTCKITSRIWIDAAGCNNTTPSTAWDSITQGATATCRGGNFVKYGTLAFSGGASAVNAEFIKVQLPPDWTAGSSLDMRVVWSQYGGGSGTTAVWNGAVLCVAPGGTIDAAFNTFGQISATAPASGALAQADITGMSATGCLAGRTMFIQIKRDRTNVNDNFTAAAEVIGVEVASRRTLVN